MRSPSSIHPSHFGLVKGAKSARKVPRFSKTLAYRGFSASKKARGEARFNSLLERDLHTLLEVDPNVASFAVEPHKLTYFMPGPNGGVEKREYTPDVVVSDRRGNISVLDAKASFFRSLPQWREKEPVIRQAYEQDHGVKFQVLTERQIRAQPRLGNCQIVLIHSRGPIDVSLDLQLREILAASGPISISELQNLVGRGENGDLRERVFSTVMALVARGVAHIDLGVPLSMGSVVSEILRP